jgi:hypothetical protein
MTQKGVEVGLYSFFDLGARYGWVVNATLQQLYRPPPLYRERSGTYCTGGWMDPRAGLDGRGIFRLH